MVRACGSYPQCPGFESLRRHQGSMSSELKRLFERKLLSTLAKIPEVKPEQHLLLGVSGGQDSCALLLALSSCPYRFRISVGHLDHGLRERSQEDRFFVEAFCRELSVPFFHRATRVTRWKAGKKLSLEEAAREARLGFLLELRRELQADWLVLGHTADDQVETVLFRLLSGSGLQGLKGIPPVDLERRTLHPLLEHWREETEIYCRDHQVCFRLDPSNLSSHFPRNLLRREILPLIISFFPKAKESILRSAGILMEEDNFLRQQSDIAGIPFLSKEDESSLISEGLTSLPLAIQRRLIQAELLRLKGETCFKEVEAIRELFAKQVGRRLDLSPSLQAARGYEGVEILGDELREWLDFKAEVVPPENISLPEEREMRCEWVWPEEVSFREGVSYLDPKDSALQVRFWRPGDRFKPLGCPHTKKLQDFFVDRKVPLKKRNSIPLLFLEGDEEVACVVGIEVGEKVKIGRECQRALRVEVIERKDGHA